jgi:putative phosphoesterase
MRILLVADIHGNWPALQAIVKKEPYDVCLFLGDLVDYGLEPAPCIAWVHQHARYAIRGNHDHAVAQNVTVSGHNGFKFLTGITRPLTRERISPDDLRVLSQLPVTRMVTLEEERFLLVHGSPQDPLEGYMPANEEVWTRRLKNVDAKIVCVGHTHEPYVLEVANKLVINPGSVGQSRDGDPRASYAIIEDHVVTLQRAEYPIEDAVRPIQESSLPDGAKEMLIEVLRTGKSPMAKLRTSAPANGPAEPAK